MVTVVLIDGSSGSGKSTLAKAVVASLGSSSRKLFQQDDYFTKPFLPYADRSDVSYEDGSGIDWVRLLRDMESSAISARKMASSDASGSSIVLVVEGHMLGEATQLFFDSFGSRANIVLVLIQCAQHVCKARRLNRRERSQEEWQELSQYFDKYVSPAFQQFGIPSMESLRQAASLATQCDQTIRKVKIVNIDTEPEDSLQGNLEEILEALQQMDCRENEQAEEVEAWPSLGTNLQGFAQHEMLSIRQDYNSKATIDLECVESLSPLDMVNLSNGFHDATGHSVWMGAYLLCEALAANIRLSTNDNHSVEAMKFRQVFESKRVLELGSGTGLGGLALLKSPAVWNTRPAHVTFTDNDHEVLSLCRRNCQQNCPSMQESSLVASKDYSILHLEWGEIKAGDWNGASAFDVVLATDCIYDIGCLDLLLSTATRCLVRTGYFVLAHVPRSCLPDTEPDDSNVGDSRSDVEPPVGYHESLERHILDTAMIHGLTMCALLRPDQITPATAVGGKVISLNETSLEEMEEAGAAIFIFQKASR
ncbi:Putative methyltransferase [Seminavis robusta]|uniref:Methyltransferase n=1 Tax=Seminavis robusta TaxID=568900 RepID=A0A9N8DWL7_9STRA|nr:Putative methyltransferase [Seminavis robusta]|eukprot:Sro301_g112090.1 Putative methyltransferase (536) ;mRNA; r:75189-76796